MLDSLNVPNTEDVESIRIIGKGIEIFRDKIGFGENVKMSKGKFEGYDKNSVLEVMILTNELTTHKKFFPGKVENLDEVLKKAVEIYDNTHSKNRVTDFLTRVR
jgi:hypothetical protein